MTTNYTRETITVSTVAIGFTSATFRALEPYSNPSAIVTVESNPVRYEYGTAPTSTVGHLLNVGDTLVLDNYDDIQHIKIIRDTSASGDASLQVTYGNRY